MRLETTTVYVKVAKPTDHLAAPSPLDKLYHTPPCSSAPRRRRADVGRLRLHFLQQPSEANCRGAKVTISVTKGERPIYFTGDHSQGSAVRLCDARHPASGTMVGAAKLAHASATRPIRGAGVLRDAPTRDFDSPLPTSVDAELIGSSAQRTRDCTGRPATSIKLRTLCQNPTLPKTSKARFCLSSHSGEPIIRLIDRNREPAFLA